MLAACLEALARQSYSRRETIVVDDGSSDGTTDLLKSYPQVKVIRLSGHAAHGFVRAANAGLAAASGEIIMLLNNDTVPDPIWLEELISGLARNPWAGMAASKLMLYSKPNFFHSAGDYYATDGVPNSRGVWQEDQGQYNKEEEVFGPCAAAAAYRRTVLQDLARCGGSTPGGRVFDPQLWMYCEDVDLNLRAWLRGHRTVYVPTARVLHHLSATGGGTLSSYYVGRNFIYLLAKDIPWVILRRNRLRIIKAQMHFAVEALQHAREPAARARLRGMAVGLLTWPRVLGSRRRVLGSAKVSVEEFANMLSQSNS